MKYSINLNKKTLEELRDLINEKITYRSGPILVNFFNSLGFNDEYGRGFPPRWSFTDNKLLSINNTSKLADCIYNLFNPINFIGKNDELDNYIARFNEYLEFDGYKLIRFDKKLKIELFKPSIITESFKFNEEHIASEWEKAKRRMTSDPDGAITIARTMLESLFKYVLDEFNITYKDDFDMLELYKLVTKQLNLAPESHQEPIFKQILGGVNSVINGLSALRNKLGDAHGKSRKNYK